DMPRPCQTSPFARFEREREGGVRTLVGRWKLQTFNLPEHTTFHARISEGGTGDVCRLYAAPRRDAERHTHGTAQVRILRRSRVVTGSEGSEAGHHDPLDGGGRKALPW